jgi:Zn-dependent peptidase ImmA (M78 family)
LSWIKKTLNDLVNKYKSADPFDLASLMKVHIIYWDLHEEINGFYKYDRRNKYIVINMNIDQSAQRFTCCHELGHVILHPRVNTPFLRRNTLLSTDKIEREANEFAINLLLHGKDFEDYKTKFDILRENGIPDEMERFI